MGPIQTLWVGLVVDGFISCVIFVLYTTDSFHYDWREGVTYSKFSCMVNEVMSCVLLLLMKMYQRV
jgi:hypothetical protein